MRPFFLLFALVASAQETSPAPDCKDASLMQLGAASLIESRTKPQNERPVIPDCAQEVLLRLQISESFHVPPLQECLDRAGADVKASQRCMTGQGHAVALPPRLIRMTFHDAADLGNLQFMDGTKAPASEGGVDTCLHTALLSTGRSQPQGDETEAGTNGEDEEDEALGDPNHNRGLSNAVRWISKMHKELEISEPDTQILGAVTAMEAWLGFGQSLGMQFGRSRGSCNVPICTREQCWDTKTLFFVQAIAEPVGQGMMCPATNTNQNTAKLLGISTEELVALQGAHSVGGIIVCSGLGNVAAGAYCPNKCGSPVFENRNLDGSSFDDTPGLLDNRYYQLLANEDYEELPHCGAVQGWPQLSKRGLFGAGEASSRMGGSGGELKDWQKKDRTQVCAAGVSFPRESACGVEKCLTDCMNSEPCEAAAEQPPPRAPDENHAQWKEKGAYPGSGSGGSGSSWTHHDFVTPEHKACVACKVQCSAGYAHILAEKNHRPCLSDCRKPVRPCLDKLGDAKKQINEKRKVCKDKSTCHNGMVQNGLGQEVKLSDMRSAVRAKRTECRKTKRKERKACWGDFKKIVVAMRTGFKNCRTQRQACWAGVKKLANTFREGRAQCTSTRDSCIQVCEEKVEHARNAEGKAHFTRADIQGDSKLDEAEIQTLLELGVNNSLSTVEEEQSNQYELPTNWEHLVGDDEEYDLDTDDGIQKFLAAIDEEDMADVSLLDEFEEGPNKQVRWCLRTQPHRECLDGKPLITNGGWGKCPIHLQRETPNLGTGRITTILNLERTSKFRGLSKRVVVLPSDWSYLGDPILKQHFKNFAKDEKLWKIKFASAWNAVASAGWTKEGKGRILEQCKAVECFGDAEEITCNGGDDLELSFKTASCDKAPPTGATWNKCNLVGATGLRAHLTCDGESDDQAIKWAASCCHSEACAEESKIKEHWKATGGQVTTCESDLKK